MATIDLPAPSGINPDTDKRLDNLQANILKAHGRDEAYHIFLKFMGDKNDVKAWIQTYADNPHYITSARKQLDDATLRKENENYSGGLLGCFFLSAAGYIALGYSPKEFENSFRQGMKKQENYTIKDTESYWAETLQQNPSLNMDPPVECWQDEYQEEIHAMLLLAQDKDDPGTPLKDTVEQIKADLTDRGIAEIIACELGQRLRQDGKDFEHFGARDGISNPVFFKDEIEEKRGARHDPSAWPSLVLAKDPFVTEMEWGSYFVFRKLKQDVEAFNNQVERLSKAVNQGDQQLTRAQIIGRFNDGTPLSVSCHPLYLTNDKINDFSTSTAGVSSSVDQEKIDSDYKPINDFDYKSNNDSQCPVPIHAHSRRTNSRPRGTSRTAEDRSRRIVRRGIPYGNPNDHEVGLLFMCYQNNIHDQFEFIQRVWIDRPTNVVGSKVGDDPLVGQHKCAKQHWSNPSEGDERPFHFGGHVTLQGGEYFFAPSIVFLKNIGHD